MSNVVSIKTGLPVAEESAAKLLSQRDEARLAELLVRLRPARRMLEGGADDADAVRVLKHHGLSQSAAYKYVKLLRQALVGGDFNVLLPRHKGSRRPAQPWHALAVEIGQLPSKPDNGVIADQLRARGFNVTAQQVRRFRDSLPATLTENSPRRLGYQHFKLNRTPYVIRDYSQVPVGYQYEADGHSCDFYIEHPRTGSPFRPELTMWIDVRSRFIVSFWLSEFENSFDIGMSLSRAMMDWDHVPSEIHVDNGAYRAKAFSAADIGFCERYGIEPHFAIARNARAKIIEGEWRLFTNRCGRTDFAATYLHDRTDDGLRAFAAKWKNGKVPRISIWRAYRLIGAYVERRNRDVRPDLQGLNGESSASAASLWATLKKNPLICDPSALLHHRAQRRVRNQYIGLHNRKYHHPSLAHHERRAVIVQYDDYQDERVWVYDPHDNSMICMATLVQRRHAIPPSRIQEREARKLEGQKKRLALKVAEAEGRSQLPISAVQALDRVLGDAPPDPAPHPGLAVLQAGHSFDLAVHAAEAARPAPRRAPVIDVEAQARLIESMREEEAPEETAADRFACWLDLRGRHERGEALSEAQLEHLRVYATSPECRGHLFVHESMEQEYGE